MRPWTEGNRPDSEAWQAVQAAERPAELARLRHNWGEAYEIGWADGAFQAVRRDDRTVIRDADAQALYEAISEDYTAKAVPRETGP